MFNMGTLLTSTLSGGTYHIPAGTYSEYAFCGMLASFVSQGVTRGTTGGAFKVDYVNYSGEPQVSNFYNISQVRKANSGSSMISGEKYSFSCSCRNNSSSWNATTQAIDQDNRAVISGAPPSDTRNYSLHSRKEWGANSAYSDCWITVLVPWNFT